jgi:hypothetical protein
VGSESAGFEQTPCDVVGQVPESERGAAEVFEAAVDGLCRGLGYADCASVVADQRGWWVGVVGIVG